MKNLTLAAMPVLLAALIICSCDNGTGSSGVTPVSYKVYDKYYYRGPEGEADTTYYWHTVSKAEFDQLYMYISEVLPVDTIPRADLNTQHAISFVKHTNDWYDLGVSLVYFRGDTLHVEYTAAMVSENRSFTVVQSVIVMVDADVHSIKFIENGKVVKILPPRTR